MADLKYGVIISTDKAIESLTGLKKTIESFTKELKVTFDSSSLKALEKQVQSIANTKINFDLPKIDTTTLRNLQKLAETKIDLGTPTINTTKIVDELNRIGGRANIQVIASVKSIELPKVNVPTIKVPIDYGVSSFGNDLIGKIKSGFTGLQLPKLDLSSSYQGIDSLSRTAGQKSGNNFVEGFKGAVGNILQITIGNLLANAIQSGFQAIGGFAKDLGKESINIEQSNASLRTLIGNQEKATKTIKELQVIARTTPYAFPELIETTKNLIAFGVGTDKAVDVVQKLGDIAQGDKTKLKNLGLLYGKIASQDFVSAGNVNSATKFGITISDIASELGITNKELTKLKSSGKLSKEQIVSYEEFDQVITELTTNTGRFKDASINASKTLGGLFSNIPDIFGNILDDLLGVSQGVDRTGGAFKILKNVVTDFNNSFLGTDFTAYTLSFGSLFQTIIDTAKSAFSNIQKYIKNVFGDINITDIFSGIGKGIDTFGSILNQIDFTNITKFFAGLYRGIDFTQTGNNLVDFVKNVQDLSTAISKTPQFKFLEGFVAGSIKTLGDDLVIFSDTLKKIKDNETAVSIIADIGTGITAIAVALAFLNTVALLTKVYLTILNADPIVLTIIAIVGAITLVGIAAKYLLKELDKFNESETGKKLSKDFNNAIKTIGDFFNSLAKQYRIATAIAYSFWFGFSAMVVASINRMIQGWNDFWKPVNDVLGGDFSIKVKADYQPNPDLSNLIEGQTVQLTVETKVIPLEGATTGVFNPSINPTQQIGGLDGGVPSYAPDVVETKTGLDEISAYFTKTWEDITIANGLFFADVKKWFDELPTKASEALEFVKQWFIAKYNEIVAYLQFKFEEVKAFFDSLPTKASEALEGVKQWFITKYEEIKKIVEDKIKEVGDYFNTLPGKAETAVANTAKSMREGFAGVVTGILDNFIGIGGKIAGYFEGIQLPTLSLPPIKLPALPDIGKFLSGGQQSYTGDRNFKGGITEIAERGRELVRLPNGVMSLFNERQFTALPKGTVIYNNADTEQLLSDGALRGSSTINGSASINNSRVANTVVNSPTNIYSTNYNGYQQSGYLASYSS
jgi:Tape measure protein